MFRLTSFALAIALLAVGATTPPVQARGMSLMAEASHGRYLGRPDLALTSAMVAAGGGGAHGAFSSATLSAMLAGTHRDQEFAHLNKRFGADRVTRFFTTFDTFVNGAADIMRAGDIALPPPNAALARNPYVLAASLRRAGVMPDGRFDVGYFIEHLVSRPIHIALMEKANDDATIGPDVNADFHVILTAEMNDLKELYRLPH